jgi:ABC-type transport system involved in multi-copper enzyme maturation permease subunit
MFALIRREIRDHIAFFIGAVILSGILIGVSISLLFEFYMIDLAASRIGVVITVVTIIIIGFFAMGAIQMNTDRTRRISAFVLTLPVGRGRILLARMAAGTLAILILLVPLAIATTVLLRLFTPPIPVYSGMLLEIFAGTFLVAFACYCIGLQAGWNSNRLGPSLGGLGLTCILVSIILVKGYGLHVTVILVLFIAASLIRTWHTFTSTSL